MCELTWGKIEEYAMQFLQQRLDFDTRLTNLSWEAIEFHKEDVDVSMFPERLLKRYPLSSLSTLPIRSTQTVMSGW